MFIYFSIALKPPSPWALYATLSLALIHDDLKLAQLVLKELQSLKDQSECIPHYVTLLSLMYLLQVAKLDFILTFLTKLPIYQERYDEALAEVSKMVHRHPDQASVWLVLGTLLLYIRIQRKLSKAASHCIQNAMHLGKTTMNVTKVS